MKEEKLQSDIAVAFSQRYPKKYGQLFHVSNERNNQIQVLRSRAIGIIPGVSDFIFFSSKINIAMEIKVPNSRHEVSKILIQLKWAKVWESQGNVWRLVRSVNEAMSCIEGDLEGLTRKEVKGMIKKINTKTIKF